MQKVSGSAWGIYNTSTDRQYLVSYYMNRQGKARSILLSQEIFFIFGVEQTPDFPLLSLGVTKWCNLPLTLEIPEPVSTVTPWSNLPWLLLWRSHCPSLLNLKLCHYAESNLKAYLKPCSQVKIYEKNRQEEFWPGKPLKGVGIEGKEILVYLLMA